MAEEIKKKTGKMPELIKGGGGIFDVKTDGKIIFSKHKAGRFPDHAEILSQLG